MYFNGILVLVIKGILQDLLTRSTLKFEEKKSNFVTIVIFRGILMYPVKDSAERGKVFSKYRFLILGDPK